MPSGLHISAAISEITVPREARQRRELDDIAQLADSIHRLGLIHAIVITRDHVLVAGERRLEACRSLGWTHIPAQYEDDVDEAILHAVELEENIKRKDLTWHERTRAIARYHEMRSKEEGWSQEKTAAAIGIEQHSVSRHLLIDRELDNPLVSGADKFSVALGAATRAVQRRAADESIHINPPGMHTQQILHGDFTEWAASYRGPSFNLIHCDFPYGINAHTSEQSAVGALGRYDDSPEVYLNLIKALCVNLDNFCAPSAHMIFWCSSNIDIMSMTWQNLKLLDGFKFDETPLIWMKSDGAGIAPDVQRRPRRTYETAFFGWRGDRKLIHLVNNTVATPTERQNHPHEKSQQALEHFFRMLVDSNTRILDPTCGSGSALRAAIALGSKYVLGIERDEEFATTARRLLADQRARENTRALPREQPTSDEALESA